MAAPASRSSTIRRPASRAAACTRVGGSAGVCRRDLARRSARSFGQHALLHQCLRGSCEMKRWPHAFHVQQLACSMGTNSPLWLIAPEQLHVISKPPGATSRIACTGWGSRQGSSAFLLATRQAHSAGAYPRHSHSTKEPHKQLLLEPPSPVHSGAGSDAWRGPAPCGWAPAWVGRTRQRPTAAPPPPPAGSNQRSAAGVARCADVRTGRGSPFSPTLPSHLLKLAPHSPDRSLPVVLSSAHSPTALHYQMIASPEFPPASCSRPRPPW